MTSNDERLPVNPRSFEETRYALLALPTVPKYEYLVEDGRVFVLNLLVHLVMNVAAGGGKQTLAASAAQLMAQAWVEPRRAVSHFGVCAYPYSIRESRGRHVIVHDVFDAALPPVADSHGEACRLMERLLLGESLGGKGGFTYRGQAMTLRDGNPFAEPLARPVLDAPDIEPAVVFSQLAEMHYEPGFAPLSAEAFAALKRAEIDCAETSARIEAFAHAHASKAWSFVRQVDDGVVRRLHRQYDHACSQRECWPLDAEEGFVFYLLAMSGFREQLGAAEALSMGKTMACLLHGGAGLSGAMTQAQAWSKYAARIERRAFRAAMILGFLDEDASRDRRAGRPLHLWAELLQAAGGRAPAEAGPYSAPASSAERAVPVGRRGTVVFERNGATRFVRA